MGYTFLEMLDTPSVRAAQAANNGESWRDFGGNRDFTHFTQAEAAFIAARDSFYLATVSESGWPYVQHRGGPKGFLCVVDETTLAFPDYRGNRQYISLGNLAADDRAALFLMDYPNRRRLKLLARMKAVDISADPELAARLAVAGYRAVTERAFVLRLEAFDWNCQQHITPRFTEAELEPALAPVRRRIEELTAENEDLKRKLRELAV